MLDIRRIASELLKTGKSRIKILDNTETKLKDVLTREDVKDLIAKGVIYTTPKKGTNRIIGRKRDEQKKKGRRRGQGSRKGKAGAREDKKEKWMQKIRALRGYLKDLLVSGKLDPKYKKQVYSLIKGGSIKGKKALHNHLVDLGFLDK